MSNKVSISAEADKESIFVYENTGKYSEKNKCGWGSPNLKISDITRAEFIITPPGKPAVTINVHPTFPNDQGYGYEIIAADLGLQKIISGIWPIEYKAYYEPTDGDHEIFQAKCYFLFDEVVACCVLAAEDKLNRTDLEDPKNQKILDARRWLEQARRDANNGQFANADKLMKHLSRQCDCCL